MVQTTSSVPVSTGVPVETRGVLIHFPGPSGSSVFSSRDLIELLNWRNEHGCRLVIEHGRTCDAPDCSAFALIYAPQSAWACWGVTRSGKAVTLWDCRTSTDIGQFATMQQALDCVPAGQLRSANAPRLASAVVVALRHRN